MPTLPQINLNGSSASRLLDAYCAAGRAVMAAMNALTEAEPNMRDYQTVAPAVYTAARDEHVARLKALRAVYVDMQALAEHCAESTS